MAHFQAAGAVETLEEKKAKPLLAPAWICRRLLCRVSGQARCAEALAESSAIKFAVCEVLVLNQDFADTNSYSGATPAMRAVVMTGEIGEQHSIVDLTQNGNRGN